MLQNNTKTKQAQTSSKTTSDLLVSTEKIDSFHSLPDSETTLYRNGDIVIRVLPHPTPEYTLSLTLYLKMSDTTTTFIPQNSTDTNQSATTDDVLPRQTKLLYRHAVETIEKNLDVSRQTPPGTHGVCHRKHPSAGLNGIVSIRTQFK